MEKWSLKPAPTQTDERRHVLHFQGDTKDFVLILKRFGAICGRPNRTAVEPGFNFKVYLNKPGPETLDDLSSFLTELSPPPSEPAAVEAQSPAAEGQPPAPEPALPEIQIRSEPPAPPPPPPIEQAPPAETTSEQAPASGPLPPPASIEQLPLAETTSEQAPASEPLPRRLRSNNCR